MERNYKRKEKKKKTEKGIFSPDWLYQPGLEMPALGVILEVPLVPVGMCPHSILVNRPGTKGRAFSPGVAVLGGFPIGIAI